MEQARATPHGTAREVFAAALYLGLTSFGGPVAHLGYFRREYVERRRWLDEPTFAELIALCQSLPGPVSSQVGIAIGTLRAGIIGGVAAFLGFTAPSALALMAFAALTSNSDLSSSGWLHGVRLVAVPVVAIAAAGLARTLAPDWRRRLAAVVAVVLLLLVPGTATQLAVIGAGAVFGLLAVRGEARPRAPMAVAIGRRFGAGSLILAAAILLGLTMLRVALPPGEPKQTAAVVEAFYRSGSLVFGGGHVVLPLLHDAVVAPGWVGDDRFLAGYGAAQAVPGPLFTFAGYLGWVLEMPPNGPPGAVLALGAIFLPSFLLVFGALPFLAALQRSSHAAAALAGINAVVVGILLAALYDPVWTSSVRGWADVAIAAVGLLLLVVLRAPPWVVVVASAAMGAVEAAAGLMP